MCRSAPTDRRTHEWAIPARLDNLSHVRWLVDQASADCDFNASDRYALRLAVHEALANAIEWGAPDGSGNVRLRLEVDAEGVVVEVTDYGGFRVGSTPASLHDRGRGFAFIYEVMDEVDVDEAPGHTTVRFRRRPHGHLRALERRSGARIGKRGRRRTPARG